MNTEKTSPLRQRKSHWLLLVLILSLVSISSTANGQMLFTRGDCNVDGGIDIADAILGLGILFSGSGPAACADSCDVNDDGGNDISDPIYLLGNLFSGGPTPPEPSDCGPDPTTDGLDCITGPTSCPPPVEDCTNGVDDDGDSLIDCNDPDCNSDPSCAPPISFEIEVYPVVTDNCVFCHGPPSNFANLDLSTEAGNDPYARIVDVAALECSSYDLVEPGDSMGSWIYRKISATHIEAATAAGCDPGDAGDQMPLGPFCCLTQEQIDLIQEWIDSGANP